MSATGAFGMGAAAPAATRRATSAVRHVYRAECRKLGSQLATRVLAVTCVLAPFAFAGILKAQSGLPADTLFGVWARSSGFALSLVILSFAGAWGFPVIAGVVAGDIFSSEDRYGTWKTVLTRSCARRDLFAGKLLAAATFSVGLTSLAAAASLVAGLALIGTQSLVGLSGALISPGACLVLVVCAWVVSLLPVLAFTALAVLFSVATRNGIIGVMGPTVISLLMQLLALIGNGVWVHTVLIGGTVNGWHGLFTSDRFYGPLIVTSLASVAWIAACVGASWLMLRRRDFAGSPPTRKIGWVRPVRAVLVTVALIALLALACNWGPTGVTAARMNASITPTFNNLTLLQQRELGRTVPAGAKLQIQTLCSRRSGTNRGPGDDWACTLDVFIPQLGAVPYQQTPVTYDVSVQSDGCYKAEAPPSFVGQQDMRAAGGRSVVNPLFTIYGCFNTF